MKIVDIRHTTVPIRSEMKNAFISFAEMDVSIVAVITDGKRDGKPLIGFGFNSNGRYAQPGILSARMVPRLLRAAPETLLDETTGGIDPLRAWDVMMSNEKPGGHGERSVAVGVIDMALWDLAAKQAGLPLYQLLQNRFGATRERAPKVFVYAAGGYYDSQKGLTGLKEEMRRYLDLGYTTVKMKIGGAPLDEDLRRIDSVLSLFSSTAVGGAFAASDSRAGGDGPPSGQPDSGIHLAVDANGRFDRKTAIEYARALAPYGLLWYEEPGEPLDFELNAEVVSESSTPIATGENLFSHQDARNLLRYGGMRPERDFLQMDPALSYGLTEYLRMMETARAAGWNVDRCIPHGGHQFGLQVAAGLGLFGNESYPGIFKPFGGFADGIRVENGFVRNPESPGIGIEQKAELHAVFRDLLA